MPKQFHWMKTPADRRYSRNHWERYAGQAWCTIGIPYWAEEITDPAELENTAQQCKSCLAAMARSKR